MDKDQTWVDTLPYIGLNVVDMLHLLCHLTVRWTNEDDPKGANVIWLVTPFNKILTVL